MSKQKGVLRSFGLLSLGLGLASACAFDDTLRAYLDAHFWLPYSKQLGYFAKKNVRRLSEPYAGMDDAPGDTPLAKLRAAYRMTSDPDHGSFVSTELRQAVAIARADKSLATRDREEVELIDAKIDMREGEPENALALRAAQQKLRKFLSTSRTPEFRSEARGWVAHIDYLLGNQTAAGKFYLDELNRNGSNLSRATMLNSLKLTYGYDGGPQLMAHLDEYFDTPAHAAFAIQLVTNPRWNPYTDTTESQHNDEVQRTYLRIRGFLQTHADLLKSASGPDSLAALGMRTALRMGDPPEALRIARDVPAGSGVREDPDFNWMLASADFLTHDFAAAEEPLLNVFRSSRSAPTQKASAAYGLCGVYEKTGNVVEQIRYALWLHAEVGGNPWTGPSGISDQTVYWAASGFDLDLLLDDEASIDQIQTFLDRYPDVPHVRVVRYSLAVRLARDNRYDEAAQIYSAINANRRAPRMKQMAALYSQASDSRLAGPQVDTAKYKLAEYLSANPERIYYNDVLWYGMQRYALTASTDSRLTREERAALIAKERNLRDDQDERWRAYVTLREVVDREGKTDLGRQAAQLALRCLRGLSERFGRQDEIRQADSALSVWLRK